MVVVSCSSSSSLMAIKMKDTQDGIWNCWEMQLLWEVAIKFFRVPIAWQMANYQHTKEDRKKKERANMRHWDMSIREKEDDDDGGVSLFSPLVLPPSQVSYSLPTVLLLQYIVYSLFFLICFNDFFFLFLFPSWAAETCYQLPPWELDGWPSPRTRATRRLRRAALHPVIRL
jgi:hypothetical protein